MAKNFSTGEPIWTWPEWRKAASGTRFVHNRTGNTGTYIKPAKTRHNGAIVLWDRARDNPRQGDDRVLGGVKGASYVVSPAADLTPIS
jgi:hypothetical protein